ncbi:MAG: alpha/beta hydrolase [Ignavibacteriaceae bacterium]
MKPLSIKTKRIIYLLIVIVMIIAVYGLIKFYLQSPQMKEHIMEKVVSNDGTEIGYVKKGNGPALILVHGTTADHTRWLPIIPYFENHFTLYAMDRRGRGGSGDSPVYSIMKEAEDIAAVAESVEGPVFLLGHSYGGLVSLEAALLTDKVRKLILYEPPVPTGTPLYPPGTPEKMQALIDKNENEAALEVMLKEVVKMPDYEFEKYSKLPAYKKRIEAAPTIPREVTVELNYKFIAEKFAGLKIPVLLLLGGDSPAVFREATELLDTSLPKSRVVILPGQQHIAMDTNTELFVETVNKFLSD